MAVKMFCDGPECEVIALVGDSDWWLVQQLRETFHFHSMPCLGAWASSAAAQAIAEQIEQAERPSGTAKLDEFGPRRVPVGTRSHQSAAGACSHPWHLRAPDRRGDGCPRCGTLAVTEPVPGT